MADSMTTAGTGGDSGLDYKAAANPKVKVEPGIQRQESTARGSGTTCAESDYGALTLTLPDVVESSSPAHSQDTKNAQRVATESNNKQSRNILRAKAAVEAFAESMYFSGFMSVLTIWALYQGDIRVAATGKEADLGFQVVISMAFFLFFLELLMFCFYKEGYMYMPEQMRLPGETWSAMWMRRLQLGSFYFWLDIIATASLVLELSWIIDPTVLSGIGTMTTSKAGNASRAGARAGRIVRVVRMVRLVRMIKLYKYAAVAFTSRTKATKAKATAKTKTTAMATKIDQQVSDVEQNVRKKEDMTMESHVGVAMTDLTNKRVIVLILTMLIIVPLLTVSEADISLSLAVQFVHDLAVKNEKNPDTYQSGLDLAIKTVKDRLPVIGIAFNGNYLYRDSSRISELRTVERTQFELEDDGLTTLMVFDQRYVAVQQALFSIYTTSFILVLLVGGTYFFSSDVTRLVIVPIERLVDLVRKISANPLGVEYKMLGSKEGFYEGMETTVLLATINKIGGLMRVGFGEAGASVIAKNLAESSGGRLNLLGSGTLIHSIFGFCDVRQFTDTTECLQEEVMLFVNSIAHILHSIVVQCSGSANKNIGDAFLLTWKLDDKLTPEQVSSLADQALLAFVKSLIELSRHQDFICNFSVAATARLYQRFPEYNVRIGCGLHVGWAIEGAIGSNRKIDASYLSPHVNNTEYLESSTKQYGVPLLMSEPFFKLLSPAASRYCRQVDRVRRSELEEPMGLFTYDSDLNINWNDPFRKTKPRKKFDPRSRMLSAAMRAKANVSSKKQSAIKPDATVAMSGSAATASAYAADAAGYAALTRAMSPGGTRPAGRQSVLLRHDPRRPSSAASASASASAATGQGHAPRRERRASAFILPGLTPSGLPDVPPGGLPLNFASASTGTGRAGDIESASSSSEASERSKQAPTIEVKKYEQSVWETDSEVVELRHRVNDSFRALWQDGIAAFIKGDWQKARDIFHETMRTSNNKDGPSKFLIAMIDEHEATAPHDWPGYRNDF